MPREIPTAEVPDGIMTSLGEYLQSPDSVTFPTPSRPYWLLPQHHTEPSSSIAQMCLYEVETAVAVRPVGSGTREGEDTP